jgi:hypothetical protein
MKAARFLLAASLLFAPHLKSAQQAAEAKVVYVNVVVTNSKGQFITGLLRENFKLFEDNRQQNITYLSKGDMPISVGIVLDGSTRWKDEVKAAAVPALSKDRMREDEIFLKDSPDLTTNDAVYHATNQILRVARNTRRAVVLFTDRLDPGIYTYSKFKDVLRDNEIAFFVVAAPTSTADRMRVLTELADDSGGKAFLPASPAALDLKGISQKILQELRHGYLIGYRPTNTAEDGKWRKIKVAAEYIDTKKNKVMKLNVRAKDGYYAPASAAAIPGKK